MKESDDLSFTLLFSSLVKRRKLTLAIVGMGCVLSLLLALLLPKKYKAESIILPTGDSDSPQQLNSALSSMNININLGVPTNSSFYFPTILNSRNIRVRLLESPFTQDGKTCTLEEILDCGNREKALEKLSTISQVSMNQKTGVITMEATTGNPELSALIVERNIKLLEDFLEEKHSTRAWSNYKPIQDEIARAETELFEVEEELARFEKNHRDYYKSNDPKVLMEHERLLNNLELKTEVYINLIKQSQLVHIQMERESPIVRVLDKAKVPILRCWPRRKSISLLGGIISLLAGILTPVIMEVTPAKMVKKLLV
jgi:uncharacterized protein involved in exopolysaccharide biosynthesis